MTWLYNNTKMNFHSRIQLILYQKRQLTKINLHISLTFSTEFTRQLVTFLMNFDHVFIVMTSNSKASITLRAFELFVNIMNIGDMFLESIFIYKGS